MLKIWVIPFGFMGFLQYFVTSAFPKAMVEDIWTFLGNKYLFLIEMNETDMSLFPFEYARAMDLSDFHPLWKSDYFEKDLIIFKTCPDVPMKGGTLLRQNWILMPSKCATLLWSDLDLMSRIISYEECSNGTWALLEHYAIKMTNYINPMGKWSPTEGLEIPQPQIWERRANLHGHILRATALEWIWFAFPVFDMQGSLVDYTGLGPTILKELAKALNFQVTFEEPPDCTWQGTHPNGSSYGMFGFLVRKEVDITGSPMVIVPERQEQIDFTLRIHAFKQDLVSAHAPEGTRVNFWVYFDAFTFSAWISLLICGFIFSLIFFLCGLALQEGIGLSSALRIVLGNGTIQVSHVTLKQLHLIITLGTSFILMAYNGNLTSTMTVQLNPPPIDSLEKIVAGNAKLLMWVDTIYTIMLSKAPPGDFKHKLWQHILKGSDQPLVNDSEVRRWILEMALKISSLFHWKMK
ncbi:hypothetical protein TCAL_14793 [Tigriopus californicus]|uniref:Ionotropic glutamate receptor L-glutamate and glycine-binding domain-containing protein n=1 Tax=Tigriopus californicus TaxID=6832 RepID=A0A553PNM4_TIGCA|nr:hypothetical protein TCAL_14793 [Tigriopus californicus]